MLLISLICLPSRPPCTALHLPFAKTKTTGMHTQIIPEHKYEHPILSERQKGASSLRDTVMHSTHPSILNISGESWHFYLPASRPDS